MSGILGPLAVVPISSAPQADLPDYVEPARAFFGDDAAVEAYLTQLEGYAADGAEATDLLDAAEAAGTVSEAIAILAGGASPVETFDTLADVIAAGLPDAAYFRLEWTGDTYIPDGEVVGQIVDGEPSWDRLIPWSKIGTTPTLVTSSGGSTLGTGAGGRPLLSVPASDGADVEAAVGLSLRTPRRLSAAVIYTTAAPPDSGSSTLALQMRRVSDGTKRLWAYLIKNPLWECGYFQTDGAAVDQPIGDDSIAAQFAAGRRVDLTMTTASERILPQPSLVVRGTSVSGTVSTTSTAVISTNGDFTAAQSWDIVLRLRSTGVVGTALWVGFAFAAPE